MLPDQVPSAGEGVWARFFNKPAYTMTLAARLAQQAQVPVILTAGERLPQGQGWRIHYLRIPEPYPTDLAAFVQTINDAMRSEEHTSELQSRGHLVCRLLLEKKKQRR